VLANGVGYSKRKKEKEERREGDTSIDSKGNTRIIS